MNRSDLLKFSRQSGRTTQLIDKAIKAAKEGRAVYLLAHDTNHCRNLHFALLDRIRELGISRELGIKIEIPPGTFDAAEVRLIGAHPNCLVLMDHYAIEMRYGGVIAAWLDANNIKLPAVEEVPDAVP